MRLRSYQHTDVAPYWRFRPTDFYEGAFCAEIMFCGWTCEHCWSQFGWHGVPPNHELGADDAAAKLVAGVERHGLGSSLITGGEPLLYWEHLRGLLAAYLASTGASIVVETSGSVGLSFERLDELDALGDGRVTLVMGLKATSPEGLASLTGMAPAAARAAHQRALDHLLYAARRCPNLVAHATVLDAYAEPDAYAAIAAEAQRATVLPFKRYRATTRFYVPKRARGKTLAA